MWPLVGLTEALIEPMGVGGEEREGEEKERAGSKLGNSSRYKADADLAQELYDYRCEKTFY